jgi:hypothetical protein
MLAAQIELILLITGLATAGALALLLAPVPVFDLSDRPVGAGVHKQLQAFFPGASKKTTAVLARL